tara:strand:- start:774 stop:1142 length:369 start_codon:yes stop_codon:yes gene_type:complete
MADRQRENAREIQYLTNPELKGLHQVLDFYKENENFENFKFNEEHFGNGYLIVLKEVPEDPDFITSRFADRLVDNDIIHLRSLRQNGLIKRMGGNDKNGRYALTEKGLGLVSALEDFYLSKE